jgi:CHASE2 domain-containing sensor protein
MFFTMNDRAVIRSFETGQGKRLAILAIAIAVLALVIGVVALGFHNRHITRSTDALIRTEPATHAARPFPSR